MPLNISNSIWFSMHAIYKDAFLRDSVVSYLSALAWSLIIELKANSLRLYNTKSMKGF